MKNLYVSTFFSIILAFLLFLEANNQPIQVVTTQDPPRFTNIIKLPTSAPIEPNNAEINNSKEQKKIKIEIFDDFNCTDCSHFVEHTIPSLKEKYANNKSIDIQIYLTPKLDDQNQMDASMAVKCAADQEQFWSMYDNLHKQNELTKAVIQKTAQELKLDMGIFQECLNQQKHRSQIENDVKYAQEKNIITKPTIIIENYMLIGDQPIENIEKIFNFYNF